MRNDTKKRKGLTLIELLLSISAIIILSIGIWKLYNWVSGDTKLVETTKLIQELGVSLTPDVVSVYKTDVAKMAKDGIIPAKYVQGNKIITPLNKEVVLKIEPLQLAQKSSPDFKNSGKSKLKYMKISYEIDGENCYKFFSQTRDPFQYIVQTNSVGHSIIVKNDIMLKGSIFGSPKQNTALSCQDDDKNAYHYYILFKENN